jgi:glycosyltransferase involved in cell wall biosynthesis
MVRVLHVITGLGMGGAENVLLELSKESLRRTDSKMKIFSFGYKKDLLWVFEDAGIDVEFVGSERSVSGYINILQRLLKKIKIDKYDIIHAHMFHSLLVCVGLKLFYPNLRIVFTAHNINFGSKLREFLVFFLRPFRNQDIIFSLDTFKFFNRSDTKVIANGICTNKYNLNLPKFDVFTFLLIGRIETVKNHFALMDFVNKINNKFEYQILIAGGGANFVALKNEIKKNGLENKIKLLGVRHDIANLTNQSHAFLLPSLWEGMPISLLEAGASGIPVISTPVGSIPSIITEKNGYLVSIDQFSKTMEFIMVNYDEAKVKGEVLRGDVISKFDISIMYNDHVGLYNTLL